MLSDIRNLLEIKKQQELTNDDLEKIQVIEQILDEEGWMFKLDMDTVVGILEYLGVAENKILKTYYSLISSESYLNNSPKERVSTID